MDAAARRAAILRRLESADRPLSASLLGEEMGVSRQVVVGDVALLRTSGSPVLATNRGYLLARPSNRPRRSFYVQHTREDIAAELAVIINEGGAVLDTSIEHRLYGQITVDLHLHSRAEVEAFLRRLENSSALSELTNGWHTHTVEANSEAALDAIAAGLDRLGFLREAQ
ncbi:transcription repressor NadR [Actinomyces oricola]|uniref:transcription repressor NadR n=1 Tax=Actinomyces oricola TaxID=206043 RepID=UPI000FFEEB61|nr:transcription repressor NadR [Actinomyces oricola]